MIQKIICDRDAFVTRADLGRPKGHATQQSSTQSTDKDGEPWTYIEELDAYGYTTRRRIRSVHPK